MVTAGAVNTTDPSPRSWLYLFSSTTRALYISDALSSLALPRGWTLHFRYAPHHIDHELLSQLRESPDGNPFVGRTVVISFVHQVLANPSDSSQGYNVLALFPLRLGEIVSTALDGNIAHFWFKLGDHLFYEPAQDSPTSLPEPCLQDQTPWQAWQAQSQLSKAVRGRSPFENVYATSGEPIDLPSTSAPGAISRAFQSTVDAISDNGFRGDTTIFALFHGLRQVTGSEFIPVSYDPTGRRALYRIKDGKTYDIEVTTYDKTALSRPLLQDAALELAYDPSNFVALGRTSVKSTGRYDLFSYLIATRKRSEDQWTAIAIQSRPGVSRKDLDPDEQKMLDGFTGAEWIMQCHIESNKRRRWVRGVSMRPSLVAQ